MVLLIRVPLGVVKGIVMATGKLMFEPYAPVAVSVEAVACLLLPPTVQVFVASASYQDCLEHVVRAGRVRLVYLHINRRAHGKGWSLLSGNMPADIARKRILARSPEWRHWFLVLARATPPV